MENIVFYYVRLLCYHMAYLPLILIFIGDSPNYSEILHKYFIPTSILPNFMALYIYNFYICNLCLISFQTVPILRSLYSKWSTISAEAPESTVKIDEVCMWDKCVLVSDLQKSHTYLVVHMESWSLSTSQCLRHLTWFVMSKLYVCRPHRQQGIYPCIPWGHRGNGRSSQDDHEGTWHRDSVAVS